MSHTPTPFASSRHSRLPLSPDTALRVVRLLCLALVALWGIGVLTRPSLIPWGRAALMAENDYGAPLLPVRAVGSLVLMLADPASKLGLIPLVILGALLVELLIAYIGASGLWTVALGGSTAYYHVRTLTSLNRHGFPDAEPAELYRAIGPSLQKDQNALTFVLSRTPNAPVSLGMQIRTDDQPPAVPERSLVVGPRSLRRRATRGPVRRIPVPDEDLPPPSARQHTLMRTLERALVAQDESLSLERAADPLAAAAQPGRVLLSQEFALAQSAHWPLVAAGGSDGNGRLLQMLARSLRVPAGVVFQEFQLALRPLGRSNGRLWQMRARWWAARLRRSDLSSGLSFAPESSALAQKAADVTFAATIRLVVIVRSQNPADIAAGRDSLEVMAANLKGLEVRHTGPSNVVYQRLEPIAPPSAHRISSTTPAMPRRLQQLRQAGSITGWAALLAAAALVLAGLPAASRPWTALPWWAHAAIYAAATLHAAVAASSGLWLMALAQPWAALRRIGRRYAQADPLLFPAPLWRQPAVLSAAELGLLWRLPTKEMEREVAWLRNRILPAPESAFLPDESDRAAQEGGASGQDQWLTLGSAYDSGGRLRSVGLPLKALHQMMHITAGMGAGKSQVGASMCWQLIPYGFLALDGKGDDEGGGLAAVVRRYVPVEEEHRLFFLNVLETAFPIGLNPIYHMMVAMEQATAKAERDLFFNEALGLILGLFERLDPGRWKESPGMQQFALMGCHLVLRTGSSKPGEIPTMAKVARALEDENYRKVLIDKYPFKTDTIFRFWTERQEELSDSQKSSLQALLRRLDLFMTNPITRPMLSVEKPSIDLREAMDTGLIVLIPMPHRRLGGLAPLVGMLIMQSVVAAAYARKGDALSRETAPVFIDEVQVFIVNKQSPDLEQAFTQLRGFAVPLIVMHQTLDQLGDLESTIRINAANRAILRTGEPDASTYAKDYAHTGMVAEDIKGMAALHHQYAVTLGPNREQLVFSLRPNSWPVIPRVIPPRHLGEMNWQSRTPVPAPDWDAEDQDEYHDIDQIIADIIYRRLSEKEVRMYTEQLALMPTEEWQELLERWDEIRGFHRQYILDHPGVIPDQIERQTWLSNLAASRSVVIEEALAKRQELLMAVLAGAIQLKAPQADELGQPPASLGEGPAVNPLDLPTFTHMPTAEELRQTRELRADLKSSIVDGLKAGPEGAADEQQDSGDDEAPATDTLAPDLPAEEEQHTSGPGADEAAPGAHAPAPPAAPAPETAQGADERPAATPPRRLPRWRPIEPSQE